MKKRLVIIGFDEVAKLHYNELRRSDFFEITGVFGREAEHSCKAEIYDDLNDLLATKPDIVLISDPAKFSADFSKITKFCKCIFLLSPIAKNIETIKEMKYCGKGDGATIGVGFLQRFNQALISLKKYLLKENKIYSVNIAGTNLHNEVFAGEIIESIDIIVFLSGSEVISKTRLENRREGSKNATSVSYHLKLKNGILAGLQAVSSCQVKRRHIEVVCESGAYFGDLINLKLYKYTASGQQNLKVDSDTSPLRVAHEQLYGLCSQNKFASIATLEEALKVQEIYS